MPAEEVRHLKPSRAVEIAAVAMVRAWVDDRGQVIDRGDGPDPDFWIDYNDERCAVGEVGWHPDEQMQAMWSGILKMERHQIIDLDAGLGQWQVGLELGANIKALRKLLPGLIEDLAAAGIGHLSVADDWRPDGPTEAARRLGIRYLNRLGELSDPGPDLAVIFPPGTGGFMPTDPDLIVDWIDDLLRNPEYTDAWGKLLHIDADERHVFFMAGSRTDFGVQQLLRELGSSLPTRAPQLPTGISHLWAMAARPVPRCGRVPVGFTFARLNTHYGVVPLHVDGPAGFACSNPEASVSSWEPFRKPARTHNRYAPLTASRRHRYAADGR
jgi:hypothetical protein